MVENTGFVAFSPTEQLRDGAAPQDRRPVQGGYGNYRFRASIGLPLFVFNHDASGQWLLLLLPAKKEWKDTSWHDFLGLHD